MIFRVCCPEGKRQMPCGLPAKWAPSTLLAPTISSRFAAKGDAVASLERLELPVEIYYPPDCSSE